jgi:RNA polymerase sigma-70 factor, ECF subfamily
MLLLSSRWLFSAHVPKSESTDRGEQTYTHAYSQETLDFEHFFWRYEGQISRYLWHMTGDEQVAYDLSQETFIRAWRHFADIKSHPQVQSWLFRVATNLALTAHRQKTRQQVADIDDFQPTQSDPGRRIAERELVQQTLQALTPKQRGALLLHEVHGFSCDEIGDLLGISSNAARMALFRAREQFRAHYPRDGGDK